MTKTVENYAEITAQIVIGPYLKDTESIDEVQLKADCTAILSLQSDEDLESLNVDVYELQNYAEEHTLNFVRIPMLDFHPQQQQKGLGEAVYTLSSLLKDDHRVYVHCTASRNRSPLVVLAYLTFCRRMPLDKAHQMLLDKHPLSAPPIGVWRAARCQLLAKHQETIKAQLRASNSPPKRQRIDIEKDILQSIFN